MKNNRKKLITFLSVTLLFITLFKEMPFASEQVQGNVPGPTDIAEGISWWDWPQEEMTKVLPAYEKQVDIHWISQYQLISEHGRQFYIETNSDNTKTYFFTDMKIADNKWLYCPAWLPDSALIPGAKYFNNSPPLYQADVYSSKTSPYTGYNAYWSDENGVYITALLGTYKALIPETVVVPKTIGGKPVIGVWLTGNHNIMGYLDGPENIYLPNGCAIISGGDYWGTGKPKIIRY